MRVSATCFCIEPYRFEYVGMHAAVCVGTMHHTPNTVTEPWRRGLERGRDYVQYVLFLLSEKGRPNASFLGGQIYHESQHFKLLD